jgi:hypothetical protein
MNSVNRMKRNILVAALMCVGLFVLYLFFSGLYYETTDDGICKNYIAGWYSGGSNALPDTFGCYVLISGFLNWLYNHFPGISWFDIFHFSFLSLGFILLLRLFFFNRNVPDKIGYLFLATLITITIAGVFFVPVEFAKTTIFLSGLSMIEIYRKQKTGLVAAVFFLLLFFIGLLMRIEAALLGFVITSSFFLSISTDFRWWLRKSIPPFLLVILVSLLVNFPKTKEEEYYLKIRAYEYAITDFDRANTTVRLRTEKDSVIFAACTHFFFADSANCNVEYFKKIGIAQFDKTPVSILNKLIQFKIDAGKVDQLFAVFFHLKWLLCLFLISLIGIQYLHPDRNKLLLANIFGFCLLVFISIWLKPEDHVIYPVITLLLLLNIYFLKQEVASKGIPHKTYVLIIPFICFLSGELLCQYQRASREKERSGYYSSIALYLKNHPVGHTILNIGCWDQANNKLFQANGFAILPNAYLLDGGILYFNQGYQDMMRKTTGKEDFLGQWEYFIYNKGSIFVSSQKRMDLILSYMNTVYHKKYTLVRSKEFNASFSGTEPLALFQIIDPDKE